MCYFAMKKSILETMALCAQNLDENARIDHVLIQSETRTEVYKRLADGNFSPEPKEALCLDNLWEFRIDSFPLIMRSTGDVLWVGQKIAQVSPEDFATPHLCVLKIVLNLNHTSFKASAKGANCVPMSTAYDMLRLQEALAVARARWSHIRENGAFDPVNTDGAVLEKLRREIFRYRDDIARICLEERFEPPAVLGLEDNLPPRIDDEYMVRGYEYRDDAEELLAKLAKDPRYARLRDSLGVSSPVDMDLATNTGRFLWKIHELEDAVETDDLLKMRNLLSIREDVEKYLAPFEDEKPEKPKKATKLRCK